MEDKKTRAAYSGVPGCFAEEAAMKYFASESPTGLWEDVCTLVPTDSFAEAMEAVEKGKADCAVLPIENSSTGSILNNYDLITEYGFYIVGEYSISVSQCLLAKPGTDIHSLREVYSHEQGLSQSRDFLSHYPQIRQTPVYNTAYAAKMVAQSDRTDVGAIASVHAAEIYGLEVLQSGINFKDINQTRFFVLAPAVHHSPENDKASLMVTLPHVPGSLCRLLSIFAREGINLMKIESRPVQKRNWEYYFFIDLLGDRIDARLGAILQEISDHAQVVRVLGYYKKFTSNERE